MDRFKTVRGWCVLTSAELRLEESFLGQLKRYYEGATDSLLGLVLAVVMAIYFPWKIVDLVRNRPGLLAYLLGLVALLLVVGYTVDWLRGFTRVESIPLSAITEIHAVDGSWWTHQRLIVVYGTEKGPRKRRIRLPSRHVGSTAGEFDRAKNLLQSAGIPLSENDSPLPSGQSSSPGET